MSESLEQYKKRIASLGGKAFSEKYTGTKEIKAFSKKGVEARRKNKAAREAVENSQKD